MIYEFRQFLHRFDGEVCPVFQKDICRFRDEILFISFWQTCILIQTQSHLRASDNDSDRPYPSIHSSAYRKWYRLPSPPSMMPLISIFPYSDRSYKDMAFQSNGLHPGLHGNPAHTLFQSICCDDLHHCIRIARCRPNLQAAIP